MSGHGAIISAVGSLDTISLSADNVIFHRAPPPYSDCIRAGDEYGARRANDLHVEVTIEILKGAGIVGGSLRVCIHVHSSGQVHAGVRS